MYNDSKERKMNLEDKTIEELEEINDKGHKAFKELEKRKKEHSFQWCFENLFETIRVEKKIDYINIIFQDVSDQHVFRIEKDNVFKLPF